MATIGARRAVENPLEFGIVITREDGSIERFLEKPTWGQVFSDTINTGIFVLEPEIFDYIARRRARRLLERGVPDAARRRQAAVRRRRRRATGRTSARSRPTCAAHKDILDGKVEVDIPGFRLARRRVARRGRRDPPRRRASTGPAVIGDNCRVEAGARLGEYTVLGANVRVRSGRRPRARASSTTTPTSAQGVRLRGTVVGRASDLRRGARCEEGVVLGDECFVGENAVLGAGVKVYPFKTVEAGAVVNSSIVWESRGARSLFGRDGVAGLANVDITPELAVRVAMAYAHHAEEGRARSSRPATPAGRPACSSGR